MGMFGIPVGWQRSLEYVGLPSEKDIYLGTWATPPQCVELWFESLPKEMPMIVSRIGLFLKKYILREAKKKSLWTWALLSNDCCCGVSLKTQELYALVFACRYLDIFTNFVSLYNTVMKLIFLGSSFSIVWYMRYHKVVRRSYDKDQDTFRHYFLVLPCLVLALLINEKFTFKEVSMHLSLYAVYTMVMWTFSLYLEAVAILPQLVLLQRTRNIDNLTGQYVFLLGADADKME
ncbi:ER lumen protein-retaining receptor HDEL receptor [Vigna angularis]|uniref:ER lumen protein-retaining receptor n=1 Tax=Phaseolus angularis TaxID=3914 RepID=A0A8T0KXZ0_PHAAN|nr:ER lumen protein-retaining receptor HDEL receptor [Vigna angularis]